MMDTQGQVDNGAFIPTGTIYNKVLELEKSIVRMNTIITMVGFVVAPAVSATVTLIVTTAIK